MTRSIETEDEIITEGYWQVLPVEKMSFSVPERGTLSVRLNFDEDGNPVPAPGLTGSEHCGSPTEKFKSIYKKNGEPKFILLTGDGTIEGYAQRKEGKSCEEVGGETLKGFHETIACDSGAPGDLCLPFVISSNEQPASMYVGACNDALSDVYLAVRYFEKNEWRTEGWWGIQQNKCRKVGPFPTDKAVYVVAMNSLDDTILREWTPAGDIVSGCVNMESGFTYAEKADGSCEARQTIPDTSPAPQKAIFGKLVDAGFHGLANFDIFR